MMIIDTLPWDAVTSDADKVPFNALEQIAAAVAHDRDVLDRLAEIYLTAKDRDWRKGGFEFCYIPGIIALAAPKLQGDLLDHVIALLMRWLDETDEAANVDFEVLRYALDALGPAVLPYAVKRLRERDPVDSQCLYLRGILEQLAKTDDPSLRGPAVEYCRETIDAAIAGNFDVDLTMEQAWALVAGAEPDLRDKFETLQRICRQESPPFSAEALEFGHMIRILDGEADFETLLDKRYRPARKWISEYQEMIREWRIRDDVRREDDEDSDNEVDPFFDSPLPEVDHADYLRPIVREQPRVGRNDPCLCGSGKKYKKCCGK